jgi:hypothetical protein
MTNVYGQKHDKLILSDIPVNLYKSVLYVEVNKAENLKFDSFE